MKNFWIACGAAALLCCAAPAAARLPDPIVITVDSHDYVTYAEPVVLSPLEHMVQSPELRMQECQRANGTAPVFGTFRLLYSPSAASLDAVTMKIQFHPTRIVLDTLYGDVQCGVEAMGAETGVARAFRGDFEV